MVMMAYGIFGQNTALGCACKSAGSTDPTGDGFDALDSCLDEYAAKKGLNRQAAEICMMDPVCGEREIKPCLEGKVQPASSDKTTTLVPVTSRLQSTAPNRLRQFVAASPESSGGVPRSYLAIGAIGLIALGIGVWALTDKAMRPNRRKQAGRAKPRKVATKKTSSRKSSGKGLRKKRGPKAYFSRKKPRKISPRERRLEQLRAAEAKRRYMKEGPWGLAARSSSW